MREATPPNGLLVVFTLLVVARTKDWANDEEWANETALQEDKLYFEPRPVLYTYWVAFVFCLLLILCGLLQCCRMARREEEQTEATITECRCEFIEFLRPLPRSNGVPEGGFFNLDHCPPPARGTMQMWYLPDRQNIYRSLSHNMPRKSLMYATMVALFTAFVWLSLYLLSRKKVFKELFVTFHGHGQWYTKADNYWKISVSRLGEVEKAIVMAIAFLLMYFVRQRIRWYEQLKTRVYNVQQRLELVAFMIGGFLSGDDPVRIRMRHDIYRWTTASLFFNHRALSQHLAQFSETDLLRCGLLTSDEALIVGRELRSFDKRTMSTRRLPERPESSAHFRRPSLLAGSTSGDGQPPLTCKRRTLISGTATSSRDQHLAVPATHSEAANLEPFPGNARSSDSLSPSLQSGSLVSSAMRQTVTTGPASLRSFVLGHRRLADDSREAEHTSIALQTSCQAGARVRDLLLWWVEIRIQAAVKEKLMDKDKLKKILGAVWSARDTMEILLNDSHRRPMYLQVVLMQLFVDFYVLLAPFSAIADHMHMHIMTLPWPMMSTFITAFFYDSCLQMLLTLWDAFGVDLDDLHLDPILVLTERQIFANLAHAESQQVPATLAKTLANVNKEKDDKDKGDKKDKAEKKEKGETGTSAAEEKEKGDKKEKTEKKEQCQKDDT